MNLNHAFAATFADLVRKHPDPSPAVAVSAGCDSNALLVALVDCGKRPTVLSFSLDDRRSHDSVTAEKNAATLGLPFELVSLPSTARGLGRMARSTFKSGVRGKANIEALTPLRAVVNHATSRGHRTMFTGLLADAHFGVTRSEIIKYRNAPTPMFDQYRRGYFSTSGRAQFEALVRHGRNVGVDVQVPYYDQSVRDLFLGRSWVELNKPRQKEAVRSFPGLDRLTVDKVRSNLQLGDSGVAATLALLVNEPSFNTIGANSTIAIYNAWARAQDNDDEDAWARAQDNDDETPTWCDDCGARLDVKSLCPACLPNSERMPDEVVIA